MKNAHLSFAERKQYWNTKYLEYWRARVEEAGSGESQVVAGDKKTEDDSVYARIFADNPFRPGSILDVGCAWGRMFPMYLSAGLAVSGVDISSAMVDEARRLWGNQTGIDTLDEAIAEQLPFANDTFDNLVCVATFDATEQHLALTEFFRVLKPGGMLIVTGKNAHYWPDDQAAIDAERGARAKGHPNFFTDTGNLLEQLNQQAHTLSSNYYFLRRGDFAEFVYASALPERFYEFCLIIHKSTKPVDSSTAGATFLPFSHAYSQTFLSANEADA